MSEDKLISIVDDDELARDGIRELVESFGHTVAAFSSAEDFLASSQVEETACLITDLQILALADRPARHNPDVGGLWRRSVPRPAVDRHHYTRWQADVSGHWRICRV